jgi:hypothetical protein
MKHEVATLEGALLDAAVAVAEGEALSVDDTSPPHYYGMKPYSTDWAHGGPILDREHLPLAFVDGEWQSSIPDPTELCPDWRFFTGGPTALIAAMRARVASKFGSTVEL